MQFDPCDPGRITSFAGTERTVAPSETLARLLPRMQEFGITRLADVTGLDRVGIPVALAIRPNARSVTVSQGKGLDLASAKVSALMEAIEVWHAETIERPLVLASIEEVTRSGRAADVRRLPLPARRRRPDNSRLLWIEGRDLISRRLLLVPFEMVHADYAEPLKPGHGLFPASTNGLASGNYVLEAVCAAICEVIERDALAVWTHLPEPPRGASALDLETIDDRMALQAWDKIAAAGLDLAVWDITSDLAVPSFLALIRDPSAGGGHIGLGSGAHPKAGTALLRALTEAAQTRLTYITGSRDDLRPEEFSPAGLIGKRRFAEGLLRDNRPLRDFSAIPSLPAETLQAQLDILLQRLSACGIDQVVAVDLHKERVGIPVVRIIIPGLEAPHDDPLYAPGPRARAAAGEAAR